MNERDLFIAALHQRDPAERSALLDKHCAGNPALRARVEALLREQERLGSFLERPVEAGGQIGAYTSLANEAAAGLSERPGTLIGPYKLMEQIGEGGMGLVFVAEQQQPVRRKVALKVIKPGMDTRQVVARFEAERQALALMDHHHIAKVLDGGTTAGGRPYFVMELVKGKPITDYCDQNQVSIRQRLELFVSVCQAVQYAHQKGIIHRDLKPSNVLVVSHDGTPVAKVIDFGVAKAIGQQLTDKTIYTQFSQLVGTPLYMSPEQAGMSGLDVDTRSDIYSLGVLLYELLTGTTPFDRERLRELGYDEMRRIIREEEPPKPSTRLSTLGQTATTISSQRQSEPRQLKKLIRGELDWIAMKALEQLAQTVPIRKVTPKTLWLLAITLKEVGAPEQARELLRRAQHEYPDDLWINDLLGYLSFFEMKPPRTEDALRYYSIALSLRPTRPQLHRVVAGILESKGAFAEAVVEYSKALELDPKYTQARRSLSDVLLIQGKLEEVIAACRKAIELDPKDAAAYCNLGNALDDKGDLPGAIAAFQKAVALKPDLGKDFQVDFFPAQYHIGRSEWDEAAAEYAKADLGSRPLNDDSFAYACLFLIRGDNKGYNRFCQRLIERAAQTKGPSTGEAYLLARICAMARKSPVDPARAVQWAEQAVANDRSPWCFHVLGLAQYRAGRFDEALQNLTNANLKAWRYSELNWFPLALVHRGLGHPDEARQCLDKGIQWLERKKDRRVPSSRQSSSTRIG